MFKRIKTTALSLSVVAFSGVLSAGCTQDKKAEQAAVIETAAASVKAADFTLNSLDDKPIKLSDYKGKVVILDFWATWCPPCVKEIPHFNALHKAYKDKGLAVIGVSVDRDGAAAVNKFIQNKSIDYPVVIGQEEVYKTYQAYLPEEERGGIPFTFIIDKNGSIRQHFVGYRDKAVFEEAIKPLIK
ncbi:MAG: TlpA family protein disulfide reductase [Calditrichaeota bacterium]|nr:TlpA family protein disulfide reductase [Calditrichota bacterium]